MDGRATAEAMGTRRNNRLMRRQAGDADIEEAAEHQTRQQNGGHEEPNGNESGKRHAAAVYAGDE